MGLKDYIEGHLDVKLVTKKRMQDIGENYYQIFDEIIEGRHDNFKVLKMNEKI